MASVRKGREGNLGARLRARGRREDRNAPVPPSSRALRASHVPKILFPFPLECLTHRLDWEKNGMFVLVSLRFLSNLPIPLIASLLYFFHHSVVCLIEAFNKRQFLT